MIHVCSTDIKSGLIVSFSDPVAASLYLDSAIPDGVVQWWTANSKAERYAVEAASADTMHRRLDRLWAWIGCQRDDPEPRPA